MISTKTLLASTAKSILSWRLVSKELIGIAMTWVAYFPVMALLQDPATTASLPEWATSLLPNLFWPTVAISAVSFIVASLKSALPAAIAWVAVVPLIWMDFRFAALIMLFAASAGCLLYGIGSLFHGVLARPSDLT